MSMLTPAWRLSKHPEGTWALGHLRHWGAWAFTALETLYLADSLDEYENERWEETEELLKETFSNHLGLENVLGIQKFQQNV